MTKKQILGLIVVLILSGLLGYGMLTSGHNWAYSDFAAYIMQARSIIDGDLTGFIFHNTVTVLESDVPVGPIAYPWGYPLLLAPVLALMGISTLSMKLLNILFYLLFLLCLFFLLRKRLSYFDSLALMAIFAFNPVFLNAQDSILSDIVFLFFSTFALFLIDRPDAVPSSNGSGYARRILIGGMMFAAFFVRTNGLLLLPTLVAYEIFLLVKGKMDFVEIKKNILLLATPYLVFFALWILTSLIFPDGQASHLSLYENFRLSQLWPYLLFYLNLGQSFFAEIAYAQVLYGIFCLFFLAGIFRKFKENILFILYFVLTLLLYISWPALQGIRFLFPIIPVFIYLAAQGFGVILSFMTERTSKIIQLFYRGVLIYLALAFFVISGQGALGNLASEREIHGPFDEVAIELFDYVKKNLPEDSLIIFFKPRIMRLMTGRDSILVLTCENLEHGDYVVINKKWEDMGQIAPEEITSCPIGLEKLYNNRRFVVYQIETIP
ncbi:MAG: hypothetical protein HQ525_06810 [Anaerolineae bacterium]|nr:hypothetical protein [Anaerolineae bacterium]